MDEQTVVNLKPLKPTQKAFLKAYEECAGNLTAAVKACHMAYQTHWDWLHDLDSEYPAAFEESKQRAADVLEAEAVRRAHQGTRRTVVSAGRIMMVPSLDEHGKPIKDKNGQVVMKPLEEIEYSDMLMSKLLDGNKPDKYRNRMDVTGANGGPISIVFDKFDEEA